ncbi:hypothetical protein LTR08_006010 [Meristemomyces frigidus]|nr:hypothetical protein LTR08_006010 [Meristemomyces frigidus]
MDTLHKLAGVQDASDLRASSNKRLSQPTVVIPELPPMPDADGDTQTQHLSHRASRSSLPLNRQPSHKSFRSKADNRNSTGADLADYPPPPTLDQAHIDALQQKPPRQHPERRSQDTAASVATGTTDDDFAWGPSHPCFPHPNAHCLPDGEEHRSTRVIRVRRDWLASGDLYPQYANLYPEILDPMVSDDEFRFLISNLNARLKAAFDPFSTRAWVDAVMGVLTGYLWDDFGLTGVKKGEKGIEQFLDKWNWERDASGAEVRVVQLRRTGFLSLDFVVPDPGIDILGDEDDDGSRASGRGGMRM